MFDSDYFWSRMAEPGGFARYLAEFLVQFYNSVTMGAAILAVLFMLLGIMGGYIAILFREMQDRPIYIIEDIRDGSGGEDPGEE